MADGADPVGALGVVLPACLADPGPADLAEGPSVHDPAQLGPASSTGTCWVRRPERQVVVVIVVVVVRRHDTEGAFLA